MSSIKDQFSIESAKLEYKSIGYVECPAFDYEKVYFNRHGLKHLIYKGRIPRSLEEVTKRFNLIHYATSIIKKTNKIDNEEKRIMGDSTAYFWTIRNTINNHLTIRIILRRLNNGVLHFFSIMSE
jgi:hypothetical protein